MGPDHQADPDQSSGKLPEEVWCVPHATLQVAQKSKFQYLIYLQNASEGNIDTIFMPGI